MSQFCLRCGAWRGALGLEPTWQLFIQHLCECGEEWHRVLKKTGSLFVNMGDTFATHTGKRSAQFNGDIEDGRNLIYTRSRPKQNYPEKSKLGIPYRLRFALNDTGWTSRDDIVWYKGKEYPDGHISKVAMPESVKRRFACSYEMVMRFVKTPKMNYYVNEKTLESRNKPPKERVEGQDFEWREHSKCGGKGCDSPRCKDGLAKYSFWHGVDQWFDLNAVRKPLKHPNVKGIPFGGKKYPGEVGETYSGNLYNAKSLSGSNPGDLFIIQPEAFRLEHYAVWPSALCEMMIKVGCPKEVCPKCGKPRERITKTENPPHDGETESSYMEGTTAKRLAMLRQAARKRGDEFIDRRCAIGWSDCKCGEGFVPGVVLDPFGGGSGRLAKEARKLGRQAIIVDLKEGYLKMSKDCLAYGEKELFKEKKRREKTGMSQAVLW